MNFCYENNDKTYDPENDVWRDVYGGVYVKNNFDVNNAVFIEVTSDLWIFRSKGIGYINWLEINFHKNLQDSFKLVVIKKLKTHSYGYLEKCRLMLCELALVIDKECSCLSLLTMGDIYTIWSKLTRSSRSIFRELYINLADMEICGASKVIALKLRDIKARENVIALEKVQMWDPIAGALTRDEENALIKAIEDTNSESIKEFSVRLYCWLLIQTLKRSKQIRELEPDCLKCIETKDTKEYFVSIKPVKYQTGAPCSWWPITEELYMQMKKYAAIDEVARMQKSFGVFLVFDCPTLHSHNVVSGGDFKSALQYYVKNKLKLKSRTGSYLNVTANRIRHTGATRLAFNGVPRDIISEILEHDDPTSCQAYIDAVGSELCPSMERADRNMGSLFMQLNHIYFHGKIVSELAEQPIVIPDFSESIPLFVGSCDRDTCKEGACHKHPFVGCYNGCSSFLAWREADHYKALKYAEKELDRWRKAIGNSNQTSIIKEYEDLMANVMAVIARIEQMKETA